MTWRTSRASELLRIANGSGYSGSASRIELVRRAGVMADAEGDKVTASAARHAVLDIYIGSNIDVDLVAAFAWLLHSGSRDDTSYIVMWAFKWVAALLGEFVDIRLDLVDQVIDELEKRYVAAGMSSAAATQLRLEIAMMAKRREVLPELYESWQRDESGAGSDCAACRRDKRVSYFAAMGDDEQVIVEAKPLLDGTLRCAEVPRGTYAELLLPLWRLARFEEAEDVCQRGLTSLQDMEKMPANLGMFLVYLGLCGRIEDGCKLLTTWMRRAMLTRNDLTRFGFLRGASLLFRSAHRRKMGVLHLSLPPTWPGFEADGLYDVNRLAACFEQELQSLADRFDARHANSGFNTALETDRAMLDETL